jgi:hypothetical protein
VGTLATLQMAHPPGQGQVDGVALPGQDGSPEERLRSTTEQRTAAAAQRLHLRQQDRHDFAPRCWTCAGSPALQACGQAAGQPKSAPAGMLAVRNAARLTQANRRNHFCDMTSPRFLVRGVPSSPWKREHPR